MLSFHFNGIQTRFPTPIPSISKPMNSLPYSNGFSFREKQRLPLRWFAEEVPPKKIFRSDEMQAVVPFLVEGLEKASS